MTRRCVHLAKVELLRDGRLEGAAASAMQSHLQSCAVCAIERQALHDLAIRFREGSRTVDELSLRRLKVSVLAAASAQLSAPDTVLTNYGSSRHRWWLAALVLGALCSGWLLAWNWGSPRMLAATNTVVFVQPGPATQWERKESPGLTELTLHVGLLMIRNDHSSAHERLLVRVPDGVIEDVGTSFEVRVSDGITRAVTVSEGEVAFTRTGHAALRLVAPVAWQVDQPTSATSTVARDASWTSTPTAPSHPESDHSTSHDTPSLHGLRQPHLRHPARASQPRHGGSATTRPSLETEAPPASTAGQASEDVMYLEVLRRLQEGRRPEALVAARRYLQVYPHAFRRPEIERLLER